MLELMVTVGIAAILLVVGLPSYRSSSASNCAVSTANSLLSVLTLARSESMRRNNLITACQSADGVSCTTGGWAQGTLVFVDTNGNSALDSGETVLRATVPLSTCAAVTSSGVGTTLSFDGSGRVQSQGSFVVTPNNQIQISRKLKVSTPSKLRVCDPAYSTTSDPNCS